jgi:transcriptional regulator with XRE-family HTH domain
MKYKNRINVLFGQRVRQLREQKGISQEQLGFDVGLHRTYIGQIERAEKNITLKNIEKIAQQLDVNISELMDFSKLNDFNDNNKS